MLDAALLGTGGMTPLPTRFLTSLMLRVNGSQLVVDCGEGTQVTMKLLGWGYKNIDVLCFTHFHADHIAGLPGLLHAINTSVRREPLTLVGPPGLKAVAAGLMVIAKELEYEVNIIEIPYRRFGPPESIKLGDHLIGALPLDHRGPCLGYSFEYKRAGLFDVEKARANNVPMAFWSRLQKKGEAIEEMGVVYKPEMVMGPPRRSIKVSYCTDTRPVPNLPEFIKGSDLFVCEGMYGDIEMLPKTASHKHMIFQEAAEIAKEAAVKELWLTHYSPALTQPEQQLPVARGIFPNTVCGRDRMVKVINYED
ncbi:MAG: ribonuclease Z [Clostridiales bacterium]|jgi:ribonuclease Z|nr:ribonuclease Z [Clostridiales bacterium]